MKITIFFLLLVVLEALSSVELDTGFYVEVPDVDENKAYTSWSEALKNQGVYYKLLKRAGGEELVKANFRKTYAEVTQALEDYKANTRSFWERLNEWAAFNFEKLEPINDDRIRDDVEGIYNPLSQEQRWIEKEQFGMNFSYDLVQPTPFKMQNTVIPRKVDWRLRNTISWFNDYHPNCNASYAFAVAATIEAHINYAKNETTQVSRQQFLDCIYNNDGKYYKYNPCNNAHYGINGPPDSVVRAYKFAVLNGVMSRNDYIDNEGKDQICLFDTKLVSYKIKGYVMLPKGEDGEIAMMVALAHYGPVTVSISSYFEPTFLRYGGGIYDLACSQGKILTMVVVGYGEDDGKPYWLVQNNWGNWGQYGLIKIARHHRWENKCDLAFQAIFPIIEGPLKPVGDYEDRSFWDQYEKKLNYRVTNKYAQNKLVLSLPNWPSIWGTDPNYEAKKNNSGQ